MVAPLNIAHRGASGTLPENTLEAFTHALKLGADGIELDVRRAASGELVVIHDALVNRTLAGKGRVSHKTLEELQALPVKGGGRLPILEETFKAIGKDAYCFIEIKKFEIAADVALMVKRYVTQGFRADRLIVICFEHNVLTTALEAYPKLVVGASFSKLTSRGVRKAHKLGAAHIIAKYDTVKPKHVELAHSLGLQIMVWTVNRPQTIAKMRALGVDGIMTDYPERLRHADE